MPNRLSVITTRTGDDGSTSLGDGTRVRKDALRVHALGSVDELNCHLGVLRVEAIAEPAADDLARIQNDLFDLGGELSIPGHTLLAEARVAWLDERLAHYNGQLAPLAEFILPGGTRAAALCHVARAVARRAERDVVAVAAEEPVGDAVRLYLNRLSDLLFVLARWLNREAGAGDVLWRR
ncbi:cob(I)yrinic acid a,c-diamide adenosyltransferase [Verticiella sediminum]|uniref:Cobalamin adenosyltransferase n=1 Tax=Verticiella sediminum TaxID=1247510 RepID=A0A556AEF9_9BURK|nr:cob(I)yrinic acid a,c-diamide adenosyltransferase [Verticiella sediminum]TSH91255.1 cob(I)yrinic acid a,c-diamide adenosyltransferase [Verticiella sediminum]